MAPNLQSLICVGAIMGVLPLSAAAWTPAVGDSAGTLHLELTTVQTICGIADDPTFELAFVNDSSRDQLVNLGWMLGNGTHFEPRQVQLEILPPSGTTSTRRPAPLDISAAGRIDDLLVPIGHGGGRHVLQLRLSDFPAPGEPLPWASEPAGLWRVKAHYAGEPPSTRNADMAAAAHFQCWTGRLESNTAEFTTDFSPATIATVYAAPWTGYEETTLTLTTAGRYLLEHFTDAGGRQADRKGTYTETSASVVLSGDARFPKWVRTKIEGTPVLIQPDANEHYRTTGELPRFGVLLPRESLSWAPRGPMAPWQTRE